MFIGCDVPPVIRIRTCADVYVSSARAGKQALGVGGAVSAAGNWVNIGAREHPAGPVLVREISVALR